MLAAAAVRATNGRRRLLQRNIAKTSGERPWLAHTTIGTDVIWLDGAFVPWREAKVHVLTHALHYASSVFEGERAYGGEIFKSREHTERLLKSCDYLDIPHPYTADEIEAAKAAALAKSGLTDAYVRPVVWRGSGPDMGVGERAQPGASRHRGLGVGRLLRRRQDEGRQARHLDVEAAEPGDDPLLRQGGGALHDLHHVQARRRGQGLLGRDHDGLPRLRRRGDRGQRLLREGRRGAHAPARLLPQRHHPADGAADAEGEAASRWSSGTSSRRRWRASSNAG